MEDEQLGAQAQDRGSIGRYRSLFPCAVGLALAYAGWVVAVSGGHPNTGQALLTDGTAVVALVALLLLGPLGERAASRMPRPVSENAIGIAAAASFASFFALACVKSFGIALSGVEFALSSLGVMFAIVGISAWFAKVRGIGAIGATVMVFGAHALAEVFTIAVYFLPEGADAFAAAVLVLLQAPMTAFTKCRPDSCLVDEPARFDDYFSFARKGIADRRFLAACAVGLAMNAIVLGFLRGFCDGHPVELTPVSRVACFLVAEAFLAGFVLAVLQGRRRAMTVGIWIAMELLAAVSLMLYAGLHAHLEVGAVPAMALNSLTSAFVWYLVVAFMMVGEKSALYYTVRLSCLWIFARSIGRLGLAMFLPIYGDTHITGTLISLMLLVSTQIVLVKLLDVTHFAADQEVRRLQSLASGADAPGVVEGADGRRDHAGFVERALGLGEASSINDVREAATKRAVAQLGEQFLLSEREIEVLSLYVLGYTQKRLAEELVVTQATVKTHIKRVYAKTGMHSRQEIVDYLQKYVD